MRYLLLVPYMCELSTTFEPKTKTGRRILAGFAVALTCSTMERCRLPRHCRPNKRVKKTITSSRPQSFHHHYLLVVIHVCLCILLESDGLVVLASGTAASSSIADGSAKAAVISSGLVNHGNTCYINSQLECAFHIPYIRSLVLSPSTSEGGESESELESEAESEAGAGVGAGAGAGAGAEAQRLSEGEATLSTSAAPGSLSEDDVSPGLLGLRSVFTELMASSTGDDAGRPGTTRALCKTIGVDPMEQQDAQEFWKLLLPQLRLPKLVDVYQGAYEDYIVACDDSGRERRIEEPFLDISLEVSSGSVLAAMKDTFGKPELLSKAEGNGWRPEKGAEKVDAMKGSLLRVQGLPSLLQLHLKRFNYDWQTDVMTKINDRFEFPKVLDLSEICTNVDKDEKKLTVYDLQSVIVHVGQFGSGHYYAYIRPDMSSDEWFRFDDDRVTPVDFADVIDDACGGQASAKMAKKRNPLMRLFGFGGRSPYGWGGRESCAYMLQYARRTDFPLLYCQYKL